MQSQDSFLPYGRQLIEPDDEAAVLAVMRSSHLAHGPTVGAFETAFARAVGSAEAVAVSSGTAALHLLYVSLDLPAGSKAYVPAITFLSTATAAIMAGLEPVMVDVDPSSGLMTPETLGAALKEGPGVVAPVHLGGVFCDLAGLARVAAEAGLCLIEDACHAVGGTDAAGRYAGASGRSLGAAFSFHPVKTLCAGEGGMISLDDPVRAARLRRLRNHAVTRDPEALCEPHSFDAAGAVTPWTYEETELGFHARMCEMEAALGLSQLSKLERFAERRRHLCRLYDRALADLAPMVRPSLVPQGQDPNRHLYTVLIDFEALKQDRATVMRRLAAAGIGTQVHYIPLYRQPYLGRVVGGMRLAGAEGWYARTLTLPLFPALQDGDVERVVQALKTALQAAP